MPIGPYFVDFLCRSHRLVIEIDGHSHDVQPARDEVRDAYIESEGYSVLHFANADVVGNIDGVIMSINQALQTGPTPGPSRKREGRQ